MHEWLYVADLGRNHAFVKYQHFVKSHIFVKNQRYLPLKFVKDFLRKLSILIIILALELFLIDSYRGGGDIDSYNIFGGPILDRFL